MAYPVLTLLVAAFSAVEAATPLASSSKASNTTVTEEVYFDVRIAGDRDHDEWEGRFVVGVFGDALPMTCFNFVQLAKGFQHRHEKWHYKGARFHRIFPDSIIQTGDVLYKDGRGSRSIFSPVFIDEKFIHSHMAAGYVGMVNWGADQNGSQFYITLTRARWMDNKNVILGKVISGMDTIQKISGVPVNPWQYPKRDVQIVECGTLKLDKPYKLTEEQLKSNEDIKQRKAAKPKEL